MGYNGTAVSDIPPKPDHFRQVTKYDHKNEWRYRDVEDPEIPEVNNLAGKAGQVAVNIKGSTSLKAPTKGTELTTGRVPAEVEPKDEHLFY